MHLETIEYKHYRKLFKIVSQCEPWLKMDRTTCDSIWAGREGYVVVTEPGEVVGHITFSNYTPYIEVIIHTDVLPEYRGRFITRKIYKQVFDHVFNTLECRRAVGITVEGYTSSDFHERLGFKKEGVLRDGIRVDGKYCDVNWFSMLPHERRW